MAVLRSVNRLIWIFRLLIFTVMKGALPDVSATVVIGMNNTSALFECGASATLRCNAGISFANWQIAYRVEPGTNSSAQCFGNKCYVQNNFTGRYRFTYSFATGISDLQIDPVVIEDDGREYKCNDGTQSPLRATVKHVLRNNSVSLLNETSDGGSRITFNVRVDCTPENVNITWFSMAIDGTDFQIHKETSHNEIDCLTGNCVVNGTSKHISSLLELVVVPTNKTVEGRTFGFNVTSDSGIVSRWIPGTYKLNDIPNTNQVPESGLPYSAIISGFAIPGIIIAVVIIAIVIVGCERYRRIEAADAPETPVGFELVRDSVTEESAAFRCRPKPYQPGRQEIVLFCEQSNNGNHIAENSQIIDEAGARAITLRIYNLRQGSVYDCSVFARSNNIRSENSQKIRITTLASIPFHK